MGLLYIPNQGEEAEKEARRQAKIAEPERQLEALKQCREETMHMSDDIAKLSAALKKFLLEVATHSPPVIGIAAAWWANILKDPLVAAGFMVVYEVGVIFWKVLGRPVWDAVWEQKLKGHTINVLAEWLTTTLLNLFSNFRRQYMQQVTWDHRAAGEGADPGSAPF